MMNLNSCLISIVVPVYKVEQQLERCVKSIMCQSYQNLEIILVDDGSPDQCGKMCEEYALTDSRIKVIHKENGGISDARNYGLERADGQYIAFIDSDDYVSEDYIEHLYYLICKYQADISVCCMSLTHGEAIGGDVNRELPSEQQLTGHETCDALLGKYHPILVTAWGKLYAREIVKSVLFPKGKGNEDVYVTCRHFYQSKRVAISNRCLYAYYQNPESYMHKLKKGINNDLVWVNEQRALFFEEQGEVLLGKKARKLQMRYFAAASKEGNCKYAESVRELKTKKLFFRTRMEVTLYDISYHSYLVYDKFKQMILRAVRKENRNTQ